MHPQHLEHGAGGTAGDDAGARRCGAQHHLAGAVPAFRIVMQSAPFSERHTNEPAPRRVGRLADRFWNLAGLAVAEADATLLVADHHQCRKAETLAALDHLSHAVDVHELVGELAIALFAIAPAVSVPRIARHVKPSPRYRLRPPSRAPSASALMRP